MSHLGTIYTFYQLSCDYFTQKIVIINFNRNYGYHVDMTFVYLIAAANLLLFIEMFVSSISNKLIFCKYDILYPQMLTHKIGTCEW